MNIILLVIKRIDFIIIYLLLIIFVLVGVGFFTLLERKVLSYINNRKGPNKVGILGVGQPISDGVKLFGKEREVPFMSIFRVFIFSPALIFFFSLIM